MSKSKVSLLAVMILLMNVSPFALVQGQINESSEIKFEALATGECWIGYGGIGPGVPYPLYWAGLGEGVVTMKGTAENVLPYIQPPYPPLSYSEDLDAIGSISVGWTEEGVVHHLHAEICSTEATEGVFLPYEDHFVIPIPMLSPLEKTLMFRATIVSGSETRGISGLALFASGIYGPYPYQDIMLVLLGDMDSGTLYMIGWSRTAIAMGIEPPMILPAAKVYKSNVETGEIIDFDTLPAGGWFSQGRGINDQGLIVGVSRTSSGDHAFLWTKNGDAIDLGTLPGRTYSLAFDVNNKGQVVGYSTYPSPMRAFLWTKERGMVDLGTLGGSRSAANGINNRGLIVGWSDTSSGEMHACLWTEDGAILDLGTLGGTYSSAIDINEKDQVVGGSTSTSGEYHAFLWTKEGGMTDLGTLGGSFSYATGINDLGLIVGSSQTSSGVQHAFLWTKERGMVDLVGTLGGSISRAEGINNRGQIVGWSFNSSGAIHACLWTEDGAILDLNPTFPSGRSRAWSINDQGKIVGWWTNTQTYQSYACVWDLKQFNILIG